MRRNPILEQAYDLRRRVAVATASEGAHHHGLAAVGSRRAQDGLHTVRKRQVALALGTMVLKRAGAHRFGDSQHVGLAHGAPTQKRHVGQVGGAVGEQHAGLGAAVALVEPLPHSLQHFVEVAFRAQHLLGAERSVLVGTAGTGGRRRVHHHGLALAEAEERLGSERRGDHGFRTFESGFGQFQRARLAVLVNHGGVDSLRRIRREGALHKRAVLRRLSLAFRSLRVPIRRIHRHNRLLNLSQMLRSS